MKKVIRPLWPNVMCLMLVLGTGCSSQMISNAQEPYHEAWQKVLRSQAWKDALQHDESGLNSGDQDLYAGTEEVVLTEDRNLGKGNARTGFESKYDILVRRAYLKIIAEAEQADTHLEREYIIRNAQALKETGNNGEEFDPELETINRRYRAHRRMLIGLRSWNIFSEYGTNDLDFFKAENKLAVQEMMDRGKKESAIIDYLVYKLADLYHFEG